MKDLHTLSLPKTMILLIINSTIGAMIVVLFFIVITNFKKPAPNTSKIHPKKFIKVQLETTNTSISQIVKKISPAIVGIRAEYPTNSLLFSDQKSYLKASGIIFNKDGFIITNSHVLENSEDKKTVQVILANTNTYIKSLIIAKNTENDIAIIKIDSNNLTVPNFGDSNKLQVGETIITVAKTSDLEYMGSIARGIISGLHRSVTSTNSSKLTNLIQTDTSINPYNSGGALVNLKGQIVGINSSLFKGSGYKNIGFSIPINEVRKIAENIIKNYKVELAKK